MTGFNFLGLQTDYGISFVALALMCVPTILRLLFDAFWIRVIKKEVNHLLHSAVMGVLMVLIAIHVYFIESTHNMTQPLFFQFGIFTLFFDYGLNLIRGKKWYYIDQGLDGNQSWADRVYQKIGVYGTLGLKLWIALLCFSIYFYWSLMFQQVLDLG